MLLSVQEFVLTRVNELRSFRTKVDSPEGVRLDSIRLLLRDVILVNFVVHMCAYYLSMLIPISQA